LLVFTGKGGTGKTTVTAAMALLAARRGLRVLACEAANGHPLSTLLSGHLSTSKKESAQIHAVADNLWVVNIRPETALFEYGVLKLRSRRVTRGLLDNRVVRYFLRVIPSIAEVVTLGKLLHHVKEESDERPRFDLVLFDAPSSGHGLSLLRLPQAVLATVPAGPLHDDMFWMRELLEDPAVTAVNPVAIPEELPVNETLELSAKLRDEVRVPRGACVLNCVSPRRFTTGELHELAAADPEVGQVAARLEHAAELGEAQAQRLRHGLDLPLLTLPQLFVRQSPARLPLLESLVSALEDQVGSAGPRRTGTSSP
jgi:anion-transporting  ArsA/GET3 family ATPase